MSISYLCIKKCFTENPKYFETKYDAKLIFSNKYILSKYYYTYNNKDIVKISSSLDYY